jgi:hypothetical protein
MILFKHIKIRSYEVGLYFRDGEFKRLLPVGRYWLFDPLWKVQVDVVSQRAPWLTHDKLDVIVNSGALAGRAEVVDLKTSERSSGSTAASAMCCRRAFTPIGPASRTSASKLSMPGRSAWRTMTSR